MQGGEAKAEIGTLVIYVCILNSPIKTFEAA